MLGFQIPGFSHFGVPGDWDPGFLVLRFRGSESLRPVATSLPVGVSAEAPTQADTSIWGLSQGMASGHLVFSAALQLPSPGPPSLIRPPVRPQQVLSPVRSSHTGKKRTHHLPCLPPQDLHHLGHQQLVPSRAGPSGPGRPRRSSARRQPQPVPQRHFNGNCWLGGQTRERKGWGREGESHGQSARTPSPVTVRSVNRSGVKRL